MLEIPTGTSSISFSAAKCSTKEDRVQIASGGIQGLDEHTLHADKPQGEFYNSASVKFRFKSRASGRFILGIQYALETGSRPCVVNWNGLELTRNGLNEITHGWTMFQTQAIQIPALEVDHDYVLSIGRTVPGGTGEIATIPHIRSVSFLLPAWPQNPTVVTL